MPFPVLLDENGAAAEIVGTNSLGVRALANVSAWSAGARSLKGGHRQHSTGRRHLQLGATLIIGPGDRLHYDDYENHPGDHADLDEILDVLARLANNE